MATKMTDAEKKAAAEKRAKAKADAEAKAKADNGPMISVRTARKVKSRRRIGRSFGPEPTLILVDDLSEDEVVALEADPALVIELA